MTPYQKHVKKWSSCKLCKLCETRDKVVLCRGKLPCDVLFIGEGPGPSEDAIGLPFVGPAGKLLDDMIFQAREKAGHVVDTGETNERGDFIEGWAPADLRLAFTNIVACIPKDDSDKPYVDPQEWAIEACRERLIELVHIAQPKLVILVGKISKKEIMGQADLYKDGEEWLPWLKKNEFLKFTEIVHPAFILKTDQAAVVQKQMLIKRTIATLKEAFSSLCN